MFNFKSIMSKILLPVVAGIIITVCVVSLYSVISAVSQKDYLVNEFGKINEKEVKEKIAQQAKATASTITAELEVAADSVRAFSQTLSSVGKISLERYEVNEMLKELLAGNESFLGICTLWETNAFDGLDRQYVNTLGHDHTGRFIPYWTRNGSGGFNIEPLVSYEDATRDEHGVRAGEYYLLPRETKKEAIIEPYNYTVNGETLLVTSLISPIIINNRFKGIVGVDISISFLQKMADDMAKSIYDGVGRVFIVSNSSIVAGLNGDPELLGKNLEELEGITPGLTEKVRNGEYDTYVDDDGNFVFVSPIEIGSTGTPWSVLMELPSDVIFEEVNKLNAEVEKRVRRDLILQVVLALIVLIIVVVILVVVIKKLVSPIKEATTLVEYTSDGKLVKETISSNSKDEVGRLIKSMNHMINFLNERNEQINRIADGDLTVKVKLASDEDEVGVALSKMVTSLNKTISHVGESVSQITQGADQMSSSSQDLSQGSSEQASSLEEITAGLNEISGQVQLSAEGSIESTNLAKRTAESAEKGNHKMEELVKAMGEIDHSANEIRDVVKMIDEIAFQTNLLALNADIEAARVGKYGKGFAVVANSVRTLATKSQESVKEATAMVEKATSKVKTGVDLVESTYSQLEEITRNSVEMKKIATELSHSAQEQAMGIKQIGMGISSVEDVVQNNSANAEENAASSEELATQAKALAQMVAYFKTDAEVVNNSTDEQQTHQGSTRKGSTRKELTLVRDDYKKAVNY